MTEWVKDGVAQQACPYCGHPLNAAATLTDESRPSDGDRCVCIACLGLAVFDATGRLVPVDDEKALLARLNDDERAEIAEVRRRISVLRKFDPNWPGKRQ